MTDTEVGVVILLAMAALVLYEAATRAMGRGIDRAADGLNEGERGRKC